MDSIQIFILLIVLFLAIPFGYFLHKALIAGDLEELQKEIEELKAKVFQQSRIIQDYETKERNRKEGEEKLQKDFFQLTMAYKALEEEAIRKEKEQLEREFEVPPKLKKLEEANTLLVKEVERLKSKSKRANVKELKALNKELQKKLQDSALKVKRLKAKKANSKTTKKFSKNKYQRFYEEYLDFRKKTDLFLLGQTQKKKKKKSKRVKIQNFFEQQPERKKEKIFQEIIGIQNPNKIEGEPQVFDLPSKAYTIGDLVGINKKVEKLLNSHGIMNFHDLVQTPIADLRRFLAEAGIKTKDKMHETWPIQARLAINGEWELIKEYKKKW